MWTKIKLIAAGLAAAVMALIYALLQREKKLRAEDELGDEQAAREIEAKAHRATLDGLQKEDKIREDDSSSGPGHFT